MPHDLDPRFASLLAPISALDPCGPDLGKSSEFQTLRKLATAGLGLADQSSDWASVIELGQRLLTTTSKDLRIAGYIALAWLHRQEVEGLLRGLDLLVALLDAYPDELHPRAKRGRVLGRDRVLDWYLDQVESWAKQSDRISLLPAHAPRVQSICEALRQIPPQTLARGPGFAARLTQVCRAASSFAAPERPSASTQPAQANCVAPQDAPSPDHGPEQAPSSLHCKPKAQAPSTEQEVEAAPLDLTQVCSMQRRLAEQLRSQDPLNPLCFRLLRHAVWTPLRDRVPEQTGSVQLPTQAQRRALNAHLEHARWPGLLELSETLLAQYPLCLDLQRFSSTALASLPDGSSAQKAIRSELLALLDEHPGLENAHGCADVPLADAATRAWIHHHQPASPEPTVSNTTPASWYQRVETAKQGPTHALLEAVQAALDQAPDQLSYARRAHQIAKIGVCVPGLSKLLLHLAIDGLDLRQYRILDRELERQCLASLLQINQSSQSSNARPHRCPEQSKWALSLARRDLSAALPYAHQL